MVRWAGTGSAVAEHRKIHPVLPGCEQQGLPLSGSIQACESHTICMTCHVQDSQETCCFSIKRWEEKSRPRVPADRLLFFIPSPLLLPTWTDGLTDCPPSWKQWPPKASGHGRWIPAAVSDTASHADRGRKKKKKVKQTWAREFKAQISTEIEKECYNLLTLTEANPVAGGKKRETQKTFNFLFCLISLIKCILILNDSNTMGQM